MQHNKTIQSKTILATLVLALFFMAFKNDLEPKASGTKHKTKNTAETQWIFMKSVPIVTSDAPDAPSCEDEKYSELNIRFQNDSVFLFDKYTDQVITGKIKSKKYFEEKHKLDFYKKMLQEEVKINLGETIGYARNTRAFQDDSKLDNYFQEAFFVGQFMFIESKSCVYIYKKNADIPTEVITKNTPSKELSQKENVELPFDFNDYYISCIYPANKDCNKKYPSQKFKKNAFTKTIETAIKRPEPTLYFILPPFNQAITSYIIAYRGTDINEYYLVTMKKNKVVSKLQIGKINDKIKDFLIVDHNQIEIYTRNNIKEKRTLVSTHKIKENGRIEILE